MLKHQRTIFLRSGFVQTSSDKIPWLFPDFSLKLDDFPWPVPHFSLTFPWLFPVFSKIFPWLFPEIRWFSLTSCSIFPDFSKTFPWNQINYPWPLLIFMKYKFAQKRKILQGLKQNIWIFFLRIWSIDSKSTQ